MEAGVYVAYEIDVFWEGVRDVSSSSKLSHYQHRNIEA